jgi:MFS family permease
MLLLHIRYPVYRKQTRVLVLPIAATPVAVIVGVTLLFAITLGTTIVGNQTALYIQAPAEHVGTAAGLFRTFGYIGSIASSTITGIVFHHQVTDSGMHVLGLVLVGVSIVVLVLTVLDRSLKTPTASPARKARAVTRAVRPDRECPDRPVGQEMSDLQPQRLGGPGIVQLKEVVDTANQKALVSSEMWCAWRRPEVFRHNAITAVQAYEGW